MPDMTARSAFFSAADAPDSGSDDPPSGIKPFPIGEALAEGNALESPPTPLEDHRIKRQKTTRSPRPTLPSRVGGSYQRSKVPSACLVCRARKTKCDNVRPICGFCKSTGGDCQYSESVRFRYDPASLAIMQQLDDLKGLIKSQSALLQQQQIGHQSSGDTPRRPASYSDDSPHVPGQSRTSSHSSLYDAISPMRSAMRITDMLGTSPPSGTQTQPRHESHRYTARAQTGMDVPISSEVMAYATADMGIEAMLRWPIFRRRLEQLKIATDVPLTALLDVPPGSTLLEPELTEASELSNEALGQMRVQELVQNFLVNNNVKNPMLDPAGLREHTDVFVRRPLEYTGRNCLMYLVLAISCLSTKISDASLHQVSIRRSEAAFYAAEQYFQEGLRRNGALTFVDSLLAAQCHFLTGVYLMHTLRILPAWRAFVQAGTSCVSYFVSNGRIDTMPQPMMEANNDGPLSPYAGRPSTSTTQALEDALYWSCLKSEVELRLELGLPGSGINAVPYPHVFPCVPDVENHKPTATHSHLLAANQPEVDRTHLTSGWLFFLAEITLKRLTYSILKSRYRLDSNGDLRQPDLADAAVLDTAEYDLQLEQWLQLLPPAMQFPVSATEPLDDILPWVLRGHRIDAVELLRFPAFASVMKPAVPVPAASMTPNQAQLARDYLQNAVSRIEANAYGVFHRHQGTWLTIRSCTRSALALLVTKLAGQERAAARGQTGPLLIDDLLPARWRPAVLLVQQMLQAWKSEGRDVAQLAAIVDGLLSLCDGS